MIDALIQLGMMLIAGFGFYFWGERKGIKKERQSNRYRALKSKEQVNDALESSHAGGAAWHDRLRDRK